MNNITLIRDKGPLFLGVSGPIPGMVVMCSSLCEFSMFSALSAVPHLKTIAMPTNDVEKAMKTRLMKTAAVVYMVTGKRGMYQSLSIKNAPAKPLYKAVGYGN